jgi:uncharacterized membrane protein YkvA (DUF1232 family)
MHNVRNGIHLFRNRKTLWQMLREVFRGQYRMSFITTAIAVIAIFYIVFPFDVVPDFIPVVGWLDDGLVIYLLLKRLVKETQRFNRHKAMARRVR